MSILPNNTGKTIDTYCYVENSNKVLKVLDSLTTDLHNFYYSAYHYLGRPKYTMISVLVDSEGNVVEFYSEFKNTMNFKYPILIPQETIEAVQLIPKKARGTYLATAIKEFYESRIEELSKPRG